MPPKESIKVLKSTDSLKAFKLEVSPSSEGETNRKRRKRSVDREVEFASSTPNNAKRSKNKNSLLQVDEKKHSTREAKRFQSDQVGEISKVKELSVNKTTATNDKTCSSTNYPKLSEGTNSILQLEEQASNQESEILQNELEVDVSTIKELSENKSANNRSLKAKQSIHKGSISNNHIIFQEEEPQAREVTITETKSQPSKLLSAVSFRCPLLELDSNNVRVFKLPRKAVPVEIIENIVIPAPQSATTSQKDVLQIVNENEKSSQENVPLADIPSSRPLTPTPPNKSLNVTKESPQLKDKSSMELQSIAEQSFDLDSDDDVMVLDDTNPDDSDSDVQTVPLKDGFNEIIADMLQNAAPLKDLPNIGDTVIFKLPRSKGAALSPTTENIAGTCSYVNRRTKSISISLIGK